MAKPVTAPPSVEVSCTAVPSAAGLAFVTVAFWLSLTVVVIVGWAFSTFELSCSALIVVGLATRLATLPLLSMTFVIEVFVYPEYWTQHLMWASVLLFLLTKGPGAFSLDHYAERLLRAKGYLA